jgi:hypothetical protein
LPAALKRRIDSGSVVHEFALDLLDLLDLLDCSSGEPT